MSYSDFVLEIRRIRIRSVAQSQLVQFSQVTTTVLRPFFRDHSGEPVPEENFWTLWCKGMLTEAD